MHTKIAELMTRNVVQVEPSATLAECADIMSSRRISCLIVCENQYPVGILTERDVLRFLGQSVGLDQAVSELMTRSLVTADCAMDYRDAYHLFVLHRIRHLVVVDENGRVAGVVTETDFRRHGSIEEFIGLNTVAAIMNTDVLTIAPQVSVASAAALMHGRRSSCAVVTEYSKPIGIVTERDMVTLYRRQVGEVSVGQVMSQPVSLVEPDQLVVDVVRRMQDERIRHLVVVDTQGRTLAVVSEHDVVKQTEGQYVELLNTIIQRQVIDLELKQAKLDELALRAEINEYGVRVRQLETESGNEKALLRTLIDNIPDLIFFKDVNSVYLGCNTAFESYFGAVEREIVGKTDFDFVDADTATFFRGKDQQVLRAGEARLNEEWVQYPDGRRECLETLKTPYVNDEGKLLGMIGISRNITDRKKSDEALRTNEEKLRALFEMSPVGIARNSMDGAFIEANRALLDMVGYSLDEFLRLSYWDLTPAEYSEQENEQLRMLTSTGRYGPYEKHFRHRLGHLVPVRLNGALIHGSDGDCYIWSLVEDISERKQAEEEMQLAAMVYRNSSEAMMVTDANGVVITINPAFTELTGYGADEIVGKTPRLLSSGHHDREFYRAMWQKLDSVGYWQGEVWNRRKDGETFAEWLTINTIYREDGRPHRRVALFSDITEKKLNEELIWTQANFDPLTGLANRRMFNDRLAQDIRKAHRSGLPLALLFIDLDHFKEINDILGHDMGDRLLKDVAKRLLGCVRETDTVARLGGDEFTIILNSLDHLESAKQIAEHILDKLTQPFHVEDEILYVSASIGITFYPNDATDIEELRKNADQAMYAAKQQGRNRFSYFMPSMRDIAQHRMRLANDLRVALEQGQFRLYYQPIVDLTDGSVHKAEALLRWMHPVRGLVGPAEFITIAEETGRILDIGDWVFRQAARQVKRCRERYDENFQISVNKSPVQFQNDEMFYTGWLAYLSQLSLPGNSVVIEITESSLLDGKPIVNDKLLMFRDAGIQVAIDDFGTGYSSLAYLKLYDIDYLKIDQSFVRNLSAGSSDLVVCEAIIAMAHKLGMKVIAEGVETEQQRQLLIAADCDFAQGYLFAEPLPADSFEALLSGDMLSPAWFGAGYPTVE